MRGLFSCPPLIFSVYSIIMKKTCFNIALFTVFFLGLMGSSGVVYAQEDSIFIDPIDAKNIYRVQIPFQVEVLFSVEQIPEQHPKHEALYFTEQKFSKIALAPEGKRLAFIVDAIPHDRVGIFDLEQKQWQELDFFLEGKSLKPFWSKEGQFLVVEGRLPIERKILEVFDMEAGETCRVEGKGLGRKFLNFSRAWFSEDGSSLFFRVDYNNAYRKKVGLRRREIPPRIGQTNLQCEGLKMYSVKEFMERFPEQLHQDKNKVVGLSLEKRGVQP